MTAKAVIYARFSSDRQRHESIEDQVRVCREYADREGMEVVRVYADEAISGTTDERPEFLRMVEDARDGQWEAVLVYKLDRFSRDRYDSAVYKRRLRRCGVRVVSATEWVPDTPEGVLMESILEGYAEFYSRQLGQNVSRGMRGNALKCMTNGIRLYGYRTGADGRYEVVPEQAALVREVYERYIAGERQRDIAADMAARGVETSRGTPCNEHMVARMLHDETYRGCYHWDDIRVEGGAPRIVGDAAWDAAQAIGSGQSRKRGAYTYPLSGRLFDAETGRAWTGSKATGHGGTYRYYELRDFDGEGSCARIRCSDIEGACARAVRDALADAATLRAVAESAADPQRRSEAVEEARRALEDAGIRQRNILAAIERGVEPEGARERIEELGRRERAARAEIARERPEVTPADVVDAVSAMAALATPREVCERAVVRAVTVRPEGAVVVSLGVVPKKQNPPL